jgi:uncharacterized protein YkwD
MAQSARTKFVFWALSVTVATLVMAEEMDAVSQEEISGLLSRDRRAVFVEKEGFTDAEKVGIIEQHNMFRSQQGASNMQRMEWDAEIEKVAQAWSNKCVFQHSNYNSRSNVSVFSRLGESVYANYGSFLSDPSKFVASWHNEVSNYNYENRTCSPGRMCGHYTQVVWASTIAVGCGVKSCSVVGSSSMTNAYIVTCNYGPAGNYVGAAPFKKGPACSECPETRPHCVSGLCTVVPSR